MVDNLQCCVLSSDGVSRPDPTLCKHLHRQGLAISPTSRLLPADQTCSRPASQGDHLHTPRQPSMHAPHFNLIGHKAVASPAQAVACRAPTTSAPAPESTPCWDYPCCKQARPLTRLESQPNHGHSAEPVACRAPTTSAAAPESTPCWACSCCKQGCPLTRLKSQPDWPEVTRVAYPFFGTRHCISGFPRPHGNLHLWGPSCCTDLKKS